MEYLSHWVAVMYASRIIETAQESQLYAAPAPIPTPRLSWQRVPLSDPDAPMDVVRGEVAECGPAPGMQLQPALPAS
jgi:ABC-type dipeptide/oligopeptide/nickel transport system ATPase component